jgi:xanthine dehydrogenase accessory factor
MWDDYLETARLLREKKQSFVLATVVRTGGPTSAKSGAKAIVTEDGILTGWVGGSCAEPTVIREARNALRDGRPRLVRLSPPEELGKGSREGIVEVAQTCVSGGTLEIYIEPHLPRPHLVAVGHLPVTEALVNLGKDMGYEVTVVSPQADAKKFPRADRVVKDLDLSKLNIRRDTAIVVASHANYDEEALEAALATEAGYVSLVASRKRAADVIQYLRESQVPEEQVSRLKNPAGIDLGRLASPEEIALSIIAEIVMRRRQGQLAPGPTHEAATQTEPREATDPVCGMLVDIASAQHVFEHEGERYYFCCAGCQRSFEREPRAYLVKG